MLEGLRRVRSRQPAIGMEYLANIRDLADGTCQHRCTHAPHGDQVTVMDDDGFPALAIAAGVGN
jgi:hypothetical protein